MFTIKNLSQAGLVMTIAAAAFMPASVQAQTCADPVAADFRVDTLLFNDTASLAHVAATGGVDTLPGGRLRGDLYEGNSANSGENGNYGVVQMGIAPDGKIFIGKMCSGQVRVYLPSRGLRTRSIWAGTVPTKCDNEDGLLGVVVSPDFATTKWVYVFHTDAVWPTSPADADTGRAHVLTRYTYDSSAVPGQQLKSPKRILRVQRMIDSRAYHAAGGIDITADGTMVIGTGDDTSPHSGECPLSNNFAPIMFTNRGCDAQKSSSNTASLRGKMLRIKPIAFADNLTPAMGEGTTYTIPAGNLWEKISSPSFNPNWNPAVDSLSKVRKEIYTMGHRNPYHPRIDSKSGWIFTGEVGLDAGASDPAKGPEGRDEWNLATGAGFFGHPYCVGRNTPWHKLKTNGLAWDTATSYNCAAIQNVSPNNYGITNLPPAVPAALFYSNASNNGDDSYRMGFTSGETAVGGPMYRFDTSLVSSMKFPPQYEGKIFFFDWAAGKSSFRIIHVKPNGTIDSGSSSGVGVTAAPWASMTALPAGSYIDMRFGPEGAMYVMRGSNTQYSNFNQAAIFRIRYVGAVNNACYTPFVASVGPSVALNGGERPTLRRSVASTLVNGTLNLPIGYKSVELYNLSGRKIWSYHRTSADQHEAVQVPMSLGKGVLHAKLIP
jgi:cytochrome c